MREDNIYYFTSETLFLNFLVGKVDEDYIVTSIHKMDSLSLVVDENDTTEYSPFLVKRNSIFSNNDRRATSGGMQAYDGVFNGQTAYYWGIRSNLGSLNDKISSIILFGTGGYLCCHNTAYRKPRSYYVSIGAAWYNLTGTPSNNKFRSIY